ncbi:hypothetical protein COBT_000601 [Conglomerata obtusa]
MDTYDYNIDTNKNDEQKNSKPTVIIQEPTILVNRKVYNKTLGDVEKEIIFMLKKLLSEQLEGIDTSTKDKNCSKQEESCISISYGTSNQNQSDFGNFIKTIVSALNTIINKEEIPQNTLQNNQAFEPKNQIFGPNS